MHDGKLLGDHEMQRAESNGAGPDIQSARSASRASLRAIIIFCAVGAICSLFVPVSYLHIEQTAVLLAQAPLS
jgi:hypothetical protein